MGLYAAVKLARRGLTVVATMRDPSREDAARQVAAEAGVELDVRVLDVTDFPGARTVLADVAAEHGRIDVLVNNAGRGSVGTAEQLSLQPFADAYCGAKFAVEGFRQSLAVSPSVSGYGSA